MRPLHLRRRRKAGAQAVVTLLRRTRISARRLHHPAKFLNRIGDASTPTPPRRPSIADPYFRSVEASGRVAPVRVTATELGIPILGFSSALSYYDGLRTERLPAALIQGQRDFFGAHTYGRGIDADPTARFHTLVERGSTARFDLSHPHRWRAGASYRVRFDGHRPPYDLTC